MTHRELFKTIEEVIPTLHGWCSVERASEQAAMVLSLRPVFSVEIGVWGGRSTIAMALAHKLLGTGQVWAIDPWSREESIKGQTGANLEWWSNVDHDLVYREFLAALKRLEIDDRVLVMRMPSREVNPPDGMGFVITDGNHSDEATSDMQRFGPKMRVGGIMFCDDLTWSGGGVQRGVEYLEQTGFRHLYNRDAGAYFQKVK